MNINSLGKKEIKRLIDENLIAVVYCSGDPLFSPWIESNLTSSNATWKLYFFLPQRKRNSCTRLWSTTWSFNVSTARQAAYSFFLLNSYCTEKFIDIPKCNYLVVSLKEPLILQAKCVKIQNSTILSKSLSQNKILTGFDTIWLGRSGYVIREVPADDTSRTW